MFNLGFSELIIIAIIALIFIGPKQLPEIARTLGRVLNELKRATNDISGNFLNPDSYKKPTEPNQVQPTKPNEEYVKTFQENFAIKVEADKIKPVAPEATVSVVNSPTKSDTEDNSEKKS